MVVATDATYMREVFKLALMLAVALDADKHAVVLASALTQGEPENSWRLFLSRFHMADSDE